MLDIQMRMIIIHSLEQMWGLFTSKRFNFKLMMNDTKNIYSSNEKLSGLKENRINSDILMSGKKELTIVHNKEEYKLRLTGNGKLILTK